MKFSFKLKVSLLYMILPCCETAEIVFHFIFSTKSINKVEQFNLCAAGSAICEGNIRRYVTINPQFNNLTVLHLDSMLELYLLSLFSIYVILIDFKEGYTHCAFMI